MNNALARVIAVYEVDASVLGHIAGFADEHFSTGRACIVSRPI